MKVSGIINAVGLYGCKKTNNTIITYIPEMIKSPKTLDASLSLIQK